MRKVYEIDKGRLNQVTRVEEDEGMIAIADYGRGAFQTKESDTIKFDKEEAMQLVDALTEILYG